MTGRAAAAGRRTEAGRGGPIIWALEWRIARRRPRLFALNLAIPLLLVAPLALGGAPAFHAAAVEAVLFVLFGTFGSAIPLVRDAQAGLAGRIAMTGLSARRWIVERVLAQALLDALQLLPALAVVAAAASLRPGTADLAALAALPVVLAATLITANALGAWIAALARSIAEGALFCAVAALLLLHAGGVFRSPAPGSLGAAVERLVPFRMLHESLLAGHGASAAGAPAGGPATWIAGAFVGAAAALAICAAFGPLLLRRLAEASPE